MPTLLDAVFVLGRGPLDAALGTDRRRDAARAARAELARLIPDLPALPGRPGTRMFLVATCALVAFHRALPDRSAADNSALLRASLHAAARWIPGPVRRLYRWVFFQPWYHLRLFAGVVGDPPSSTRGDFAGRVVMSGPEGFGVDYEGCLLQTYLARVGAPELGPHVCALDEVESEIFGLGLTRTGTLGRGAARCDFRWRR